MKIKILDSKSLGDDTPISNLSKIGDVEIFESSTPDEVISRCKDADVIILNKVKITREVIFSSDSLKLVCVFATGYDNIDIVAAREKGVAVCNVPGYSSESVALITMATVLSLVTHLSEYNKYVVSGEYTSSGVPNKLTPVFHELAGKTWGIVGYGGIGKAVANIAKAFGVSIIVNKRVPIDGVECVDIDTLCKRSDIITLHCPLNSETKHLINKDRLDLMKKDVIIVNEARGAVVCEEDITEALEQGRIGAFGCDVYSVEPFGLDHPYNRIKSLPNVILTPHCAWGSYEARERCLNIIIQNILAFYGGEKLNRVDL